MENNVQILKELTKITGLLEKIKQLFEGFEMPGLGFKDWMDIYEIQKEFNMSRTTVRRRVADETLATWRFGKRTYYRVSDLRKPPSP